VRTAATNPRRAVADAWDDAREPQPEPDMAFAPPSDDIDTDDLRVVRGIMLALVLGAVFWVALAVWLLT
jgi:hypothetical protein